MHDVRVHCENTGDFFSCIVTERVVLKDQFSVDTVLITVVFESLSRALTIAIGELK